MNAEIPTGLLITFYAFLSVGGLMLLVGLYLFIRTRIFLANSQVTVGEVVMLDEREETFGSEETYTQIMYHPVVRFQPISGPAITFTSSVGANPSSYQIGQSVSVRYNPAQPSYARINSFMQIWFMPLIYGGLGIVFLGIGLAMWLVVIR